MEWVDEIERKADDAVAGGHWMEDYGGDIRTDIAKLIAAVRVAYGALDDIAKARGASTHFWLTETVRARETVEQLQSGEFTTGGDGE